MMDPRMTPGGGGQAGELNARFNRMNVNADSFVPNVQAPSFVPGGHPAGRGGGYMAPHYRGYPMHGEYEQRSLESVLVL